MNVTLILQLTLHHYTIAFEQILIYQYNQVFYICCKSISSEVHYFCNCCHKITLEVKHVSHLVLCVCVFFPSILDIKLDVPAGVTQE